MKLRHRRLFERLAARECVDIRTIKKALLVLSSRRSGSTLFCDTLSRTGKIGLCEEWFNPDYMAAYMDVVKPRHEFRIKCYLRWVACHSVGDTGVLALHVHVNQALNAKELFGAGLDMMTFDYVVRVCRRDKIQQAVSLAKALKTNAWRHDERPSGSEVTVDDCFNAWKASCVEDRCIDKLYSTLVDEEVYYEDFAERGHTDCYDNVLIALGKDEQADYSTALRPQRDLESLRLGKQLKERLQRENSKGPITYQPAPVGKRP